MQPQYRPFLWHREGSASGYERGPGSRRRLLTGGLSRLFTFCATKNRVRGSACAGTQKSKALGLGIVRPLDGRSRQNHKSGPYIALRLGAGGQTFGLVNQMVNAERPRWPARA
jgi:hypothetical protein